MLGRSRVMAAVVSGAVVVVTAVVPVVLTATPALAAGSPSITVTQTTPGTVLVGDTVPVTITAANPAASTAEGYNLSVRTVLPVGVSYLAGSTVPTTVGEPTVLANTPAAGQTTLLWLNTADLPPAASATLSFTVTPDPATYPVGSTITLPAPGGETDAYVNTNPRSLPAFDATGAPIAGSYTGSATATPTATAVSAVRLGKAEPSPQGELLRGVHDQTTVYSLTVTNNPIAPTTALVLDDYLPAGLEFLGCGGVDNTTGQTPEYPGAPPLTAVPVLTSNCPTPSLVATVTNPAGLAAGVYTHVRWTLPDLAAGATQTITYRAGIPLRSNTAPGPGVATANLDNNTGALTLENGGKLGLTNTATLSGTYGGTFAPGATNPVTSTATTTVRAADLRLVKSVSPSIWKQGEVVTFSLALQSSEYRVIHAIDLVDTLPDGLCPVPSPGASACVASGTVLPDGSTATEAAGVWTVTWPASGFGTAGAFGPNGSATRTLYALALPAYSTGTPTVSGDGFTNTATVTATSTPAPGTAAVDPTPSAAVSDTSQATLTSPVPVLSKQESQSVPRPQLISCAAVTWLHPTTPATFPQYAPGDRVCYRLTVPFAAGYQFANPVVTDSLPPVMSLDSASWTTTFPGSTNTVPAGEIAYSEADPTNPSWTLGSPLAGNPTGPRYLDASGGQQVLDVVFSAVIDQLPPTALTGPHTAEDATANLLKLTTVNTAGQVVAQRDRVEFALTAPQPALTKGVLSVAGPSNTSGPYGPNTDGVLAASGDTVTFRVDIANAGAVDPADPLRNDMTHVQVWERTATQYADCSLYQASAATLYPTGLASGGGVPITSTCLNPGVPGNSGSSTALVEFTIAGPIDAGTSATLTFAFTLPAGLTPGQVLDDRVGIRQFTSTTNNAANGQTFTYIPKNNIDATQPTGNTPPADDASSVVTPGAVFTKVGGTLVTDVGNNAANQVAVGEETTYAVVGLVRAGTTVYSGTVTDPLPAGLLLQPASVTVALNGTAVYTAGGGASPGWTVTTTGNTLSVHAPDITAPPGPNPAVVTVQFAALAANVASNVRGTVLTNTAYLAFAPQAGGTLPACPPASGPLPAGCSSASYAVTVVEPHVTLTKTNTPPSTVGPGVEVPFTLAVDNAAGTAANTSTAYDVTVADTLPAGTTLGALGTPTDGSGTPLPAADYTATAVGQQLTWTLPRLPLLNAADQPLPGPIHLPYTAAIDSPGVAGQRFTNTATATVGSSLPASVADASQQRSATTTPTTADYSATASDTITAIGPTLLKAVTPTTGRIGDTATFTATYTVPPDVAMPDAVLIDTMPAGYTAVSAPAVSCLESGGACGGGYAPTTLPPLSAPTRIGVSLGSLTAAPDARVVTLTYTAVVANVAANKAGTSLVNTISGYWNLAEKGTPTTIPANPGGTSCPPPASGGTFDCGTPAAPATLGVVEPHVVLTKKSSSATIQPGQTVTYTVTAQNTGTSPAYQVDASDALPARLIVAPGSLTPPAPSTAQLTGTNPDGSGGTLGWTIPALAVNQKLTLTYTATLVASGGLHAADAPYANTVGARFDSLPATDPGFGGARHYTAAAVTAKVAVALPKLAIAKTTGAGAAQGTAFVGQPFTWRIVVTNTGTGSAYSLVVPDTLPYGWTFSPGSASATGPGGTTTPVVGGTPSAPSFSGLPTLAAAQSVTITYTAVPSAAAVSPSPPGSGGGPGAPMVNAASAAALDGSASAGSGDGPYTAGPATASAVIDVANLAVTKTHTAMFTAGGQGVFTLTVKDRGPSTAAAPLTLVDTLPAGMTFVSGPSSGPWGCAATGASQVTCTSATSLAAGASSAFPLTVAVDASVPAGTSLTNLASVTSPTYTNDTSQASTSDTVTIAHLTDLAVVKTGPSAPVPGTDVSYSLAVANNGPSATLATVTVTDTLPAGTTFVSASSAGNAWTCTAAGAPGAQTLTCTLPSLAVGPAPSISVVVSVPADQVGSLTNTAHVAKPVDGTDPNLANNDASATAPLVPTADLAITKTFLGPDGVAGHPTTFGLAVVNNGPSDEPGPLTITDTLPVGMSYVSLTSPGSFWGCQAAGQTVTCTSTAGLASGASAPLATMTVLLASNVPPAKLVNTATVSGLAVDPNLSNNIASAPVSTSVVSDVGITKTHTGDFTAGQQGTYTVTVTSYGPSDQPGPITVTDTLPAGMTWVAGSATGAWSCVAGTSPGQVVCTLPGPLPVGTSSALPLTVAVDPSVPSTTNGSPTVLTNAATVAAPGDSNPTNNTASDPTTIVHSTDLAITKSVPATAVAGTTVDWTLLVANHGPSDTQAPLQVADTLPPGLTYLSASGTSWTCAYTAATRALACTNPGGLAAGASTTLVLHTAVDPGLTATQITNTATVAPPGDGTDPNLGNNASTATTQLSSSADLSVVKTAPAVAVPAGATTTETFAVANAGPSDAGAPVTVTDTLAPGTTWVPDAAAQAPWSCAASGADGVACTLPGSLGAGQSAPLLTVRVAVAASVPDGSALTDTATVSSPTPDPDPSNNTSTAVIHTSLSADLSVTKSHTGPVTVGQPLTFTLQVHNAGPSPADSPVLTDPLPAGLTFVSASGGSDWAACTGPPVTAAVTCTYAGPLAPGADTSPVAVVVTVGAAAYPSVVNTAGVTSTTPDPDLANNSASDPVAVPPLVDLAVTKTHTGVPDVGATLDYTLAVTNHGPTPDPGPVTLTDPLPTGLGFVSASGPGWVCHLVAVSATLTCVRAGVFDVGAVSAVTLVVDVGAAAAPSVVNTATVSSTAPESTLANNTASDPTTVRAVVDLSVVKTRVTALVTGQLATYHLTVHNAGPSAAADVVATDELPAGLAPVSASGPGWSCTTAGQRVRCVRAAPMAVGATDVLTLTVRVAASAGTTVVNTASVTTSTFDTHLGNNASAASGAVLAGAGSGGSGGGGVLPHTGADPVTPLAGLLLLVAGVAAVLASRARRRA